jgi:hypothetical protein
MKHYVQRPVGRPELQRLRVLAQAEEIRFFTDNQHLVAPYRGRLVAIALCQGAALQYLGRGYGVNDFDVHFFYLQNPRKPRLTRARKRIVADVVSFDNIAIDFLRTVVPVRMKAPKRTGVMELLRTFLEHAPTANAKHLATKAVVGLFPAEIYGKTIWLSPAIGGRV